MKLSGTERASLIDELRKRKCERSLLAFVEEFWDVIEPATVLKLGRPLEIIADHLTAVTDGKERRLLANVPPGSMKTLMVNVFWPCWEWGPCNMPYLRYVTFSYAAALTEKANRACLAIMSCEKYQRWWGDRVQLVKKGERLLSNTAMGFKLATSVGGVGTGERGDRVIFDDPHNVKDQESEVIRTGTTDWFLNAMSNRVNDLEQSAIVVIMQRVHESDTSGVILDRKLPYCHLCIPAEYDGRKGKNRLGWQDWRTEEGDSFWPERFPLTVLAEQKITMMPHAYAGQYQQIPTPKGGGVVKLEWWKPWVGKKYPYDKISFVLGSVDSAYTMKQENDPSAMTMWGIYNDDVGTPRALMLDAWAERLPMHELVLRVGNTARKYKADLVIVENKASGISLGQELERLFGSAEFGIFMNDPGNQDKMARLHAVSHLFWEGVVQVPFKPDPIDLQPTVPFDWAFKVMDQVSKFPRATHDDLTDTVTQALSYMRRSHLLSRKPDLDEWRRVQEMRPAPSFNPIYPVSG